MTPHGNDNRDDDKRDALRQAGGLHARPDSVQDDLFRTNEFFDPRDLIQVKYEMLRRVQSEGLPVAQAAARFGLSRPAYYHALQAFQADGLPGLIRKRSGPKRSHKLSAEVMAYLDELRAADAKVSAADMAAKVRRKFSMTIHPRSIEKALKTRQKKGR
jgi:transposase